ncbi:mannose-6-phosphate isomerase, type 1 [Verrucomicrobium sp. GAS474]|uniref:type I phosphomannose isomerase catalytic subunit n=1 Tax=Verrucomicrobium sp. GAS474 TaxID=1882831 RepID=UPI00087B4BF9|nr:type I phosphomannose isomerase catalytic subunit [Verrucomicrobium sp. GAS474]SDU06348.1 mannose-6-phosphate isomerase, type 1 [Verrucomicrobium sp. GAS474]
MTIYTFGPIYQERIWGGSALASLYGRTLPAPDRIGESWEVVDRPEAVSPLFALTENPDQAPEAKGTLHDLWTSSRAEVFGERAPKAERFPILIKLLDCRETLSIQVHPPAAIAPQLKGEPKTEMWYFLHTEPGAKIYAGLKKGVTADAFKAAIGTPGLAALLHELPTEPGEAMFLPSGRVHAIGAGNLILEIQQNSDTTYRVDDWGRIDKDGKPRALHIEESKLSIDYGDFEPLFAQPHGERVVESAYFATHRVFLYPGEFRTYNPNKQSFNYHFVARGTVKIGERSFKPGDGFLLPASAPQYDVVAQAGKGGDQEEMVELVTVSFPR